MTTSPPEHLLASFDPQKARIAELRGILLQHDVPYSANANKAKLVALYEQQIRPVAPRLLAALARVQPSTAGILDGESQDGSLVELDTGSESEERERKAKGKKKTVSKKKKDVVEDKEKGKGKGKGKGKKVVAPAKGRKGKKKVETESESESSSESEEEEEDQMEVDEPEPPKPKSKSKPRKSTLSVASTVLEPSSENDDEQVTSASSPKKRKSVAGAVSSAEKARQSLAYSSGPESGFSDYNPFQSGAEDTPERKLKRRKSSMGPNRRSTLGGGEEDEQKERKKARKSMPASLGRAGAGGWAEDSMEVEDGQHAASSPAIQSQLTGRPAPAPAPTPSRLSLGASTSTGTPKLGERYMVPLEQVKKTPEEARELKRRLSRFEVREPEVEDEVEVEVEQEEYEQPVDFGEEEEEDELAIQPPPPPAPSSSRKSTSYGALKHDQPATPLKRFAAPSSSSTALTPRKSTPNKRSPSNGTITIRPSSSLSTLSQAARTTTRLSLPFLLLSLLAFALYYREEKLSLGFCDTSTPGSNSLTHTRGAGSLTLAPYLPSTFLTFLDSTHLRPTCTPCPPHARCTEGKLVACDPEFAVRPHPLRLGGLLPLPPRCEPDTEKLMIVAGWAAGVKRVLEERRGEVMCGTRRVVGGAEGEGRKYGMGDEELWEVMREVNLQSPHPYKDSFLDEITRLALRDLEKHGEVSKEEEGPTIYYSTPTFRIPLSCRARLSVIRHARENKTTLSSLLGTLLAALWAKYKLAQRKNEKEKVRELVGRVLGELRKQDHLHHLDPALCPVPHLAQSHLRDFILLSEHSPSRRQRLWSQVEKVVEGNSNVRTKMVEVMGEELRGWQWTGQGGVGELSTPGGKGVYPKLEL